MSPRLPSSAAAVWAVLRKEPLPPASAVDWSEALDFADRSQITLVMGALAGDVLPASVRERLAQNLAHNTVRLERVNALQLQIGEWLAAAGIEFVFLKGTTQWPHFVSDLRFRTQYDVDLLCAPEDARPAWELLISKGYVPLEAPEDHPTDHLPSLILQTGWDWRGDHFDPDLPLAIDLHFRVWDERTERLPAPGVHEFWNRRQGHALDVADALGYSTLHLLRHLLRGSASPYHVYELAWFLDHHADDREFWNRWRALHPDELRRLEAVSFRLAHEWFGCALGPVAEEEVAGLPAPVADWFQTFAFAPLEGIFHPNKDELWLHLALVASWRDKLAVTRRRLLPTRLPGPIHDVNVPDSQIGAAQRLRNKLRFAWYVAGRVVYHARTIPALLRSGAPWAMRASGLSQDYWTFLAASSFLNLGLFIFVLLFNLYLIGLGYREDFVGLVASAGTAGVVAGTLPAAALARRFGLSKMLLVCFTAVTAISASEALVTTRIPLLALGFLGGVAMSVFAVSLAPAIARLTSEKARSVGFSFSTASSIALGVVGGWLGGHLSVWLGGRRPAMLFGCALAALSLWPAARLKIGPAPAEGARIYPRSGFIVRFLIVLCIWNLATGCFNPFFNTYFARMHTSDESIGLIFSVSQAAQVLAILLAPLVLRRLGLAGGTAAMLFATAVALGGLAAGPVGWAAAALYAAYMSFQYMTDPGINTLVMGRVREQERSGAAALMMLVSFAAQLVTASLGGRSIAKFGYSAVLAFAAGLAAIAALAFRALPAAPPAVIPAEPELIEACGADPRSPSSS